MATYTYRTERAARAALVAFTLRHLPGYDGTAAAQRVRDFLGALVASGAGGAVYPAGQAALYVEVHG